MEAAVSPKLVSSNQSTVSPLDMTSVMRRMEAALAHWLPAATQRAARMGRRSFMVLESALGLTGNEATAVALVGLGLAKRRQAGDCERSAIVRVGLEGKIRKGPGAA